MPHKLLRFVHFIIDGILIQIFASLTVWVIGYLIKDDASIMIDLSSETIIFPAFIIYYIITECLFGTTPAKILTRSMIVGLDGQKPALQSLLLRTLLRIIIPIDAISFLFDKEGIGLHDRWSGTRVVRKSDLKQSPYHSAANM